MHLILMIHSFSGDRTRKKATEEGLLPYGECRILSKQDGQGDEEIGQVQYIISEHHFW